MNRIAVRQWIPRLRRHSLSALAWVTLPCLAVSAQAQAQAPDPRPMLTACTNHTPPFVFMQASTNWPPLEQLHAFQSSWADRPRLHRLISRAHATRAELTRWTKPTWRWSAVVQSRNCAGAILSCRDRRASCLASFKAPVIPPAQGLALEKRQPHGNA